MTSDLTTAPARTAQWAVNSVRGQGAAGVLFLDSSGRVLLVEPTYKPFWDLPVGQVEPYESPRAAAVRELREELGVSAPVVTVGRLLVVDYLPAREDRPESLRLVFAGRLLHPAMDVAFRLPTAELRSWAWCTPGEQRARQVKAPMLARRVAAARRAFTTGQTVYLEAAQTVYADNSHEVQP